jgi:long-subunit acyl-CoA synthetase (AMP-forming)
MGAALPSPTELLADLRRQPWRPPAGEGPELTAKLNNLLAALEGDGDAVASGLVEPELLEGTLDLLGEGRLDTALTEELDVERLAAVGEALVASLESADGEPPDAARAQAWAWLDAVRRPVVLRAVAAASATDRWMDLILRAIDASRFNVARLLEQRVARYGPRTLFRELRAGAGRRHTWAEVASEVERVARGLLALEREHGAGPVAILSENRYEMAIVDLACLTSGVIDVMVPANATASDVAYILSVSEAKVAVVSTAAQLRKVESHRDELPELREVVMLDPPASRNDRVLRLGDVVARGSDVGRAALAERRDATGLDGLASIMFTSGTTGKPKGICFSQRNIVSKRFARAMALPEVGDQDVFLCYLPLCHTFGRYLEMIGCLFWGATYVFLEDPSSEALLEGLRQVRPTVFISIPKRWIQLWEEAGRRVDLDRGEDEEIAAAFREVVGDRLRWGLSAAGYLDPEIFRFFQRHGVELMSGFGMTEATGGITMTPPGNYRDDSPSPGTASSSYAGPT